jgi:hypothetical protein
VGENTHTHTNTDTGREREKEGGREREAGRERESEGGWGGEEALTTRSIFKSSSSSLSKFSRERSFVCSSSSEKSDITCSNEY